MTTLSGQELVLIAVRKEFKRLSKLADKATSEFEECRDIFEELISIRKTFTEIMISECHSPKERLEKLEELTRREERAKKIQKKNIAKLIDKEINAEMARDRLGGELQMMELRFSRTSG